MSLQRAGAIGQPLVLPGGARVARVPEVIKERAIKKGSHLLKCFSHGPCLVGNAWLRGLAPSIALFVRFGVLF